ncbi:glycerol uptake facilitator protein [Acanthocystis turfacea Chlorella virus MO0605SPH]|nr:glycerol uptake facilitator protein [Acanthocystis turfacea Chlorella virus MO0605SPH]
MSYSLLEKFGTEACSSFLAMLFGLSVVANDHLLKTKGHKIGFGFIAFGFGMAFAMPIIIFGFVSAHLNPAMCVALFVLGKSDATETLVAIGGELIGMFLGAVMVYLLFLPHFNIRPDSDLETNDDRLIKEDQHRKLAVFATGPAVKTHWAHSFFVEFVCTTILIASALGVFSRHSHLADPAIFAMYRSVEGITIGWLVFVMVLGMGGVTAIAANPARDFCPRLAHFVLPIANKGPSNWSYAIIPIAAPFLGGVVGAYLFKAWSMLTHFSV